MLNNRLVVMSELKFFTPSVVSATYTQLLRLRCAVGQCSICIARFICWGFIVSVSIDEVTPIDGFHIVMTVANGHRS
jgi:hypothetical protein